MIDAAIAFAIRVASAGLLFALQVLLARIMPLESYGGFVTLWTWMLAIGSLGALGLAESSVRFVPRYLARGRTGTVGAYFRFGLAGVAAASLVLAAAGVVVGLLLPEGAGLIAILVALGLPFLALEYYLEGIARGFGWYRLTTVPVYILRPVLIGVLALGLVASGVELTLARIGMVVIGAMAAITLGLALYLWIQLASHRAGPRASRAQARLWMRAALPLVVVTALADMVQYADVLLISLLLSPEQVGVYFAAARVLALANFVYFAMYLVSARRFALDLASRDRQRLQASLLESSRLTFWLTAGSVVATLAAGPLLLAAFGDAFGAGYPVMMILGVGMVARALSGQSSELLIVSGRQRQLMLVQALTLGANIALSLPLIGVLGIVGAAIGTAAAMVVRTLAMATLVYRSEGLRIVSVGLPSLAALRA